MYMYTLYYMKIHVPSMLAISVETINKQTQQTNTTNKQAAMYMYMYIHVLS